MTPLVVAVDGRVAHGLQCAGASATPALLIHGIACSSEAFSPLLRHLAAAGAPRPALAPDMPGYGRSPGPRAALDIAALADWLAALLATLAVPRVHAVGHSMGGQVALALARRAPTRVASCVLVGPTTGDELQGAPRYAAGLLADTFAESRAWNRTLARMSRQMGARRYVATLRHFLRDRPVSAAAAVRCPVLVLRGARDRIVPETVGRRLAEALPRGRYARLPVGAHALQFTHPEALWRAAEAFFAAARGERAEVDAA
jgi:2-hydroxy-6-oxonona-2,4-dienedioate hydrolase